MDCILYSQSNYSFRKKISSREFLSMSQQHSEIFLFKHKPKTQFTFVFSLQRCMSAIISFISESENHQIHNFNYFAAIQLIGLLTYIFIERTQIYIMELGYFSTFYQLCNILAPGLTMTFANPFDLVRFRMQTMPQLLRQGTLSFGYSGIFDCIRRIFKQEGPRAFWKGNLSNLLRFYPSQTINFVLKQSIQKGFYSIKGLDRVSTPIKNGLSGLLSGWLTLLFLYPLDFSRLKLSNDISGQQKGIYRCLKNTVKQRGFTEVYKGSIISFVGVGIFRATYFGIFDSLKWKVDSYLKLLAIGYWATFTAIVFTYPSDTIRRRLMMTSGKNYKYEGFLDCCIKVFKSQGIKGFFRGSPIIFFQSCAGGINLFLYEKFAREVVGRKNTA